MWQAADAALAHLAEKTMADDAHNELAQLLGPYENWVLGPAGRPHAGLDVNTAQPFQFAGLAEIRPPENAGPVDRQTAAARTRPAPGQHGDKPEGLIYPMLWSDAQMRPGPSGAHIWPCILTFPADPERGSALSAIKTFLARSLGGPMVNVRSPGAVAEYGYRLHVPLPPASFDAGVARNGPARAPAPKGDGALLASLATGKKQPSPEAAGQGGAQATVGSSHPLTVMAVIDDGLPFAHHNLRDRQGRPRMEFCWLQSADIAPDGTGTVLFGRELTRERIEALIAKHAHDEDALYVEAGSVRPGSASFQPMAQLWSHGAHVLDLAAGHDHADALAGRAVDATDGHLDRVRLIGVELPAPLVMDTVGFGKDAFILSALHYIFARADAVAQMYGLERRQVPLVINFSFGFTGGPHDGTERLEEAIAHLVRTRQESGAETRLVMPAGNDFLGALHGELTAGSLDADRRGAVHWRIQPNDRTPNYLEMWYPQALSGQKPAMPVIRPPSGKPLRPGAARGGPAPGEHSQTIQDLALDGRIIGQVSIDLYRGLRWRVMVILAPTEPREADAAACEAGLWRIDADGQCLGDPAAGHVISCRIQRDNGTQHPAQGGRQSWFDHPDDRAFGVDGRLLQDDGEAVFVRRFGSLNGLATHDQVIVVGGVASDTGTPASYSAAGAGNATQVTRSAPAQVTCSAPSDDSVFAVGQRAAGTRAASSSRLVGTSAAAPHVARGIALAFLDAGISTALADGTRIKGFAALQSATVKRRLGEGVVCT